MTPAPDSSHARRGGRSRDQLHARRLEEVARSNHRAGVVLSLVGGAFVAAGTSAVVVTGLADGNVETASAVGVVLGLAGAVCAIPGEQLRRGVMGLRVGDESGLVRSRFRLLSVRVHLAWIVVGLVATTVLVVLPVASWQTGGWPHAPRYAEGLTSGWIGYGAFVCGVTTAAATSLVKKIVSHRAAGTTPVPGSRFWRFFSYRFRLDTWLGGVGGFLAALSVTAWPLAPGGQDGSPLVLAALASTGAVALIAGVATATQFRRSGEELGSGEGLRRPHRLLHLPDAEV